jgi:putative membrane protein
MSVTRTVSAEQTARRPVPVIIALSAAVAAFLIWLIYFRERMATPEWALSLPLANAVFNSISAICLVCGYVNIRSGNRVAHKRFMLSATTSSGLFLVSYVTYHYFHGDTKFPAHGLIRPVYFSILMSHIGLSTVSLPMIFATLWYSLTGQFGVHRRLARWTFPIWLYVSVTGVVVYLILRTYTA